MAKKKYLGNVSDIDVRLLRIFRSVVECGGMAAAELDLNLSLSTVSRHIGELETRLGGHKLCHRGRGGFALTEEGRKVYESTVRLLAAMDKFSTDLDDLNDRITGRLVLVLFDKIVTNPTSSVPTALKMFSTLAPDVEISMHVEPTNVTESGVLEGKYQIGIIPYHRSSQALDDFHLFDEHMYLYCGASHPLFDHPELDDDDSSIARQPYAGLGFQSPNMNATHALGLKRKATCFDQEAVVLLILSGQYVGFLPDHFANFFVGAGKLRQIKNPRFHYIVEYFAIVRHAPAPSRVVRTFVHCLKRVHGIPEG